MFYSIFSKTTFWTYVVYDLDASIYVATSLINKFKIAILKLHWETAKLICGKYVMENIATWRTVMSADLNCFCNLKTILHMIKISESFRIDCNVFHSSSV